MALRLLTLLFMSLLCLLGGASSVGAEEDTLTLHDGKKVVGKIIKDEAETVTVQLPDGEQRAILKSKIAKIVRVGVAGAPAPKPITGMAVVSSGGAANPKDSKAAGANNVASTPVQTANGAAGGDTTALVNLIKTLSAPNPTQRRAVMYEIISKKEQAVPVMLGLLNPKANTDEYTRLGILRTLVYCLPLSDQAAETIGYAALHDPFPEVRREACVAIRALSDDRAIRLILQQASTENVTMRATVAAALHEIDDNRVLLGLIGAMPQPSVNANYDDQTKGLDKPAHYLPVGPGGATIPIFLPQGGVSGVATDLDSPITYLLKQIAGKDMGNLHYGWFNWYREKLGESGQNERESVRESRSMRDRMNR